MNNRFQRFEKEFVLIQVLKLVHLQVFREILLIIKIKKTTIFVNKINLLSGISTIELGDELQVTTACSCSS